MTFVEVFTTDGTGSSRRLWNSPRVLKTVHRAALDGGYRLLYCHKQRGLLNMYFFRDETKTLKAGRPEGMAIRFTARSE